MSDFSHIESSESLTYGKRRCKLEHPRISLLLICHALEIKSFEVVLSRGSYCHPECITFWEFPTSGLALN